MDINIVTIVTASNEIELEESQDYDDVEAMYDENLKMSDEDLTDKGPDTDTHATEDMIHINKKQTVGENESGDELSGDETDEGSVD